MAVAPKPTRARDEPPTIHIERSQPARTFGRRCGRGHTRLARDAGHGTEAVSAGLAGVARTSHQPAATGHERPLAGMPTCYGRTMSRVRSAVLTHRGGMRFEAATGT